VENHPPHSTFDKNLTHNVLAALAVFSLISSEYSH
jgi:hypothetical protein